MAIDYNKFIPGSSSRATKSSGIDYDKFAPEGYKIQRDAEEVKKQEETKRFEENRQTFGGIFDNLLGTQTPPTTAGQTTPSARLQVPIIEELSPTKRPIISETTPEQKQEIANVSKETIKKWTEEAYNTIENRARIERQQERFKEAGVTGQEVGPADKNTFDEFGDALVRSTYRTSRQIVSNLARTFGKTQWAENFSDQTEANLKIAKDLLPSQSQDWDNQTANILGEAIPYFYSIITASAIGGPVAGFGIGSILEKENAYNDYIQLGMSPEEADRISSYYGIISSGIENLSGIRPASLGVRTVNRESQQLFRKSFLQWVKQELPKIGGKTIKNALEEGGEEALQGIAQQLGAKYFDENQDIFKGLIDNIKGGAIAGLFLSGGGFISQSVIDNLTARNTIEADLRTTNIPVNVNKQNTKPIDSLLEAKNALNQDTTGIKSGAVERAKQEIQSGTIRPINVRTLEDGTLFIEDGRHRLEAYRQLGARNVPIEDVTKFYEPEKTDVEDNLIQEARKYKSAEEFVNGGSKKLYHQTDQVFEDFDVSKAQGTGGIWFTDSKKALETGEITSTGKGNIMERYINENELNLAGWDKYEKYGVDELIGQGYDGVKLPSGDETTYLLYETDKLKTKSQLIDIWNKANKPKKTDTKTTKEVKVPRSQLPVKEPFGRGDKKVSRLAARLKNNLDTITEKQKAQIPSYSTISKEAQLKRASNLVINDEERAMRIIRGEEEAPSGLTDIAVGRAMIERAGIENNPELARNVSLALELTSLRATRAGQELAMLVGMDEMNPAVILTKLKQARIKALTKADKKTYKQVKVNEEKRLNENLRRTAPTKDAWADFLEEIKCK